MFLFFFQAEDGRRDLVRSRGLGDVYKRQGDSYARRARRIDAADATAACGAFRGIERLGLHRGDRRRVPETDFGAGIAAVGRARSAELATIELQFDAVHGDGGAELEGQRRAEVAAEAGLAQEDDIRTRLGQGGLDSRHVCVGGAIGEGAVRRGYGVIGARRDELLGERFVAGDKCGDVATELLDAGALLVGSPTMNNTIFPTVADVLTYLKGLKRQNLIGTCFGSYGWSGQAVSLINQLLQSLKFTLAHDGLQVKYIPTPQELTTTRTLATLPAIESTSAPFPDRPLSAEQIIRQRRAQGDDLHHQPLDLGFQRVDPLVSEHHGLGLLHVLLDEGGHGLLDRGFDPSAHLGDQAAQAVYVLSLLHICSCRRSTLCSSRW